VTAQWLLVGMCFAGFLGFVFEHNKIGSVFMVLVAIVTWSDIIRTRRRRRKGGSS
jgi:hypothetical protein